MRLKNAPEKAKRLHERLHREERRQRMEKYWSSMWSEAHTNMVDSLLKGDLWNPQQKQTAPQA